MEFCDDDSLEDGKVNLKPLPESGYKITIDGVRYSYHYDMKLDYHYAWIDKWSENPIDQLRIRVDLKHPKIGDPSMDDLDEAWLEGAKALKEHIKNKENHEA